MEKQCQREKAYREKQKAKKLAENGGEIVKTKVCPHCQKEFIPTSNRQIFCSKDCCYQARQDKTKADREAEKGNHYYRQRVCAVCGSTYWPTHSQQKFCSAECKKVNHNKKTLEFYYKKQKEKELCKDLLQTKEQVSDTNSSEITIILPDSRGKFSFKLRAVKETLFERTQASFILHSDDKWKVI